MATSVEQLAVGDTGAPAPVVGRDISVGGPSSEFHKEIYTYRAPWPVFGLDWSKRPGKDGFRLAVTSFLEDCSNKLQTITVSEAAGSHMESDFTRLTENDHAYPASKVLWAPYKGGGDTPDLLATTGDYLRLWEVPRESSDICAGHAIERAILRNNPKSDVCAPLTSFDWNDVDSSLVVTSSIDTTCTVWNVERGQAKTQLIAHDKDVYDVAWASGSAYIFASVGADGSVRMFDLRSLEHSTIIYETPPPPTGAAVAGQTSSIPILRLAFNRCDPNYLATFHMHSKDVAILDVRIPGLPVTELKGHEANVNAVAWAPHSSVHLCTAGDDQQVLVWEVQHSAKGKHSQEPCLAFNAESEVNQICWSSAHSDWIGIGFGKTVQAVRV